MNGWDQWKRSLVRYGEIQAEAQREQEIQAQLEQEITRLGEWLTVSQVANYLEEDERTTRKRLEDGEIKYFLLSDRKTKVYYRDLVEFLLARRRRGL